MYYAVKLNENTFLGNGRNSEVSQIENARNYNTKEGAEKAANSLRSVPWYKDAKAIRYI